MPRVAYPACHAMWSALPACRSRRIAGGGPPGWLRPRWTGPAGPDMRATCPRRRQLADGRSITGDDGRDRQSEPALHLMRQVGPEPAGGVLRQRGHDDLVELAIGAHLLGTIVPITERAGASRQLGSGRAPRRFRWRPS